MYKTNMISTEIKINISHILGVEKFFKKYIYISDVQSLICAYLKNENIMFPDEKSQSNLCPVLYYLEQKFPERKINIDIQNLNSNNIYAVLPNILHECMHIYNKSKMYPNF